VAGHVDERVAIAAVQAKLIHVDLVGKRDRLRRLIPHIERFWRRIVGESQRHTRRYGPGADSDLERQ
jgi:hypothetical protein